MLCRTIELRMMIRRVFATSIVALLLAISPLAVACDLSCAFSSMKSDCHSAQTDSRDLASVGTSMDGMNMAGMDMPETRSELNESEDSAVSPAHVAHPSIGDMGPCEKQACDGGSAVFAKSFRLGDLHSQLHFVAARTRHAKAELALFRAARDEITAPQLSAGGSLLSLNLRI